MRSDEQLVAQTLRGELSAFEEIVQRHRGAVFTVAARIVGPGDAEDVSQDALLRAFNRLDRFRGEGPFRAWLLRIARNTALNALAARRDIPTGDDDVTGARDRDPPQRTPAQSLQDGERRERMRIKLRGLSPAHRAVLVLRDVEGLSYEEIAAVVDAPLGTVKGRLHRARDELAGMLRANTYDWELPDG
ncbi:MAG: sigma-70 family RNA polymerase sigma factor [Solirubrobacteraceae bacterium MAG38_C4-C5]|nr:sigma-70 family RNA polymerase sigma factor [Candidatus Siliceabacter maunaloa]